MDWSKKTNLEIKPNNYYRVKHRSPMFEQKYGDGNPIILIEDLDTIIFNGKHWFDLVETNMACKVFLARNIIELNLPINESIYTSKSRKVYYGKITPKKTSSFSYGELVYIDELEKIEICNYK